MKALLIILFLWFGIHLTFIVIDGLSDHLQPSDAGVVLGNEVLAEGLPSPRLKSRLDRAVELYRGQNIKYIIVSGGIEKKGYDEARVMQEYLIKAGIPGNVIIPDHQGTDTMATAKNARLIMKRMNLHTVTVITQYYHITRTKLAFKKAGFGQVYAAHARIFEFRDLYSLVREFFAYYKYLLIT
jgi:vancomycin permeability regulator SanA